MAPQRHTCIQLIGDPAILHFHGLRETSMCQVSHVAMATANAVAITTSALGEHAIRKRGNASVCLFSNCSRTAHDVGMALHANSSKMLCGMQLLGF